MIDWIKGMYNRFVTREIVVYFICGIMTTLVGLASYQLCMRFELSVFFSNTISSFLAIVFAYIMNKIFVFEANSWKPKTVLREVVSFGVGRFATYVMETALLMLLIDVLGLPSLGCKAFTLALVMIGNYIISKFAVFIKH